MNYRQTQLGDVPSLARIRAEEWGTQDYWFGRISGYLECTVHPQHALFPRISYVAVEQDSIVGFVAGHLTRRYGCDGELEWINVSRDRRRDGVASDLLRSLAEWFAEQNALKICVNVEPANMAASRFYARHGAVRLNPYWMVWKDIRNVLRTTLR